jgi:hypothetical protein
MSGENYTWKELASEMWHFLWTEVWGFSHLRDLKYKIKYLFKRQDLIRTNLPKTHYIDASSTVLPAMMSILVRFVEEDKCFDQIEFNSTPNWKNAGDVIQEVYAWWGDYENRKEQIEISLDNWNKTRFKDNEDILNALSIPDTEQSKYYFELHGQLEQKLAKEEIEMLTKLVSIKDYLWV